MMISIFTTSLLVSFSACFILVSFKKIHAHISSDHVNSGPQKFHHAATPRIGGIPIFLGLSGGFVAAVYFDDNSIHWILLWSICPVWIAGLIEDFTKQVSPFKRLCAAFVVALIGAWLMDARLGKLGVPGIDYLLGISMAFSVFMTMLMVGGITHSINIIDGFNGLASGFVIMVLAALALVSYQLGDSVLTNISLSLLGATLGFLFWNFPRGLIFAGDGGAYLWGAVIAEIVLLMMVRHPQVSPWFGFLLLVYPVWETVFSIYRRTVCRGLPAGLPDALHLHSLIYLRLVRIDVSSKSDADLNRRNSLTAPYLWALASLAIVPALIFWDNPRVLFVCSIAFIVFYCVVYRMIVHFKVWRWLVMR
jgi:UDP-GlcNAc:undecaprenyl-phosphate/decaprenyl-phosphate GlcNAc-1-phosphate transferase